MLERIEDENQQSQEEIDLVRHCRAKVEEARSSANRIAHEGIWMTNIAYLCGYNNLKYNTVSRRFESVNRVAPFAARPGITVNKILPTVQNRLARLCKSPPKYDVRPESNDQEDKDAARLSLQLLTSLWARLELDQKRIPLYMWVQQCGHAYAKICWDDTLGEEMIDPLTGELSYQGDVRADIVSAFEVFPDPLAKTFEEALRSWIIQAKVRKLDYFQAHYPDRGHLVKSEEAWLLSAQYEQRVNSLNIRGPSESGMVEAFKNSAIEIIKYEARSAKYPQGRMIVSANGILLRDDPLPCGEIPFAKFDDVVVGGKYYPESIITHLVPIQDQYNETVRRRADWTKKLLAGKYIAARGSGLDQEALNDQSGEVVYFDPVPNAMNGGMPTQMQVPMIPQWAYAEEEQLTGMFNDISGISEVSRGTIPSASIPAIGMQLLTEQDDTRIGIVTEQHEHAWARVGKLILKYVEKYYQLPRKLKISGKSDYIVQEISGDMIKGNTDVIVIRGSTLPGSKTLKRQEIINAWQAGLLGDPSESKVREKVLDMLEYGDVAEMWQSISIDKKQIKKGIEEIKKGIEVPVSEFDNHTLWVEELNTLRKEQFDTLSPEAQEALMICLETHVQYLIQLTNPPEQVPPIMQPIPEEEPINTGGI